MSSKGSKTPNGANPPQRKKKQQRQRGREGEKPPSAVGGPNTNQRRTLQSKGDGNRVVKFEEQISNFVPGSTTVGTVVASVNPGDPGIMPRISKMAALYTYWRFKSLRVTWMPNGSAFAANNQTGEVVVQYTDDWYSAPASSVTTARSRAPNCVSEAWMQASFNVPKKMLKQRRYVRDGNSASGADARLYDTLIYVTAAGTPNASTLGYVLISGEVELWEDYTPTAQGLYAPLQNRATLMLQTTPQTIPNSSQTILSTSGGIGSSSAFLTGVILNFAAIPAHQLAPGTYGMKFWGRITTTTSIASFTPQISTNGTIVTTAGENGITVVANSGICFMREDFLVVAEGFTGSWVNYLTVVGVGTLVLDYWNVLITTYG